VVLYFVGEAFRTGSVGCCALVSLCETEMTLARRFWREWVNGNSALRAFWVFDSAFDIDSVFVFDLAFSVAKRRQSLAGDVRPRNHSSTNCFRFSTAPLTVCSVNYLPGLYRSIAQRFSAGTRSTREALPLCRRRSASQYEVS